MCGREIPSDSRRVWQTIEFAKKKKAIYPDELGAMFAYNGNDDEMGLFKILEIGESYLPTTQMLSRVDPLGPKTWHDPVDIPSKRLRATFPGL